MFSMLSRRRESPAHAACLIAVIILSGSLVTHAAADTQVVLSGMPTYLWWGGCAPTTWGMIIGYWNDPDRYPFYDGDATVWSGASYSSDPADNWPRGTAAMVSSWDHVHQGELLNYNTSQGRGKYTNHAANCIADFLYTDNGNTYVSMQAPGIVNFAAWDNPATSLNESVKATAGTVYTDPNASLDPLFDYLMDEIDAGRPMATDWFWASYGHTIAAYGYLYSDTGNHFVAVKDTWSTGSLSQGPPGSYIDNGVEWWPWHPDDYSYSGTYDWKVRQGNYFWADPVPEPATVALFLTGVAGIGVRLRRRRRSVRDDS